MGEKNLDQTSHKTNYHVYDPNGFVFVHNKKNPRRMPEDKADKEYERGDMR